MPYRHAYLWVLALFPAVALAFWPSYFGRLEAVSWVLHAHGITASLWIALLAVQSWSVHRERRPLHKLAGRTSLALFPLFWISGLLIIRYMAAGFVARDNPFHAMYGARLVPVDLVTSVAILFLYYSAVARRGAVMVHAAAMLAIPLFLAPPIAVRLLQIGGPFAIRGADEFYKFGQALHVSNAATIVLALWLYSRRPKTAWPFLIAAGALAVESLLFETVGRSAGWEKLLTSLAILPTSLFVSAGLAVAIGVVVAAWIRPARPRPAALGRSGEPRTA